MAWPSMIAPATSFSASTLTPPTLATDLNSSSWTLLAAASSPSAARELTEERDGHEKEGEEDNNSTITHHVFKISFTGLCSIYYSKFCTGIYVLCYVLSLRFHCPSRFWFCCLDFFSWDSGSGISMGSGFRKEGVNWALIKGVNCAF